MGGGSDEKSVFAGRFEGKSENQKKNNCDGSTEYFKGQQETNNGKWKESFGGLIFLPEMFIEIDVINRKVQPQRLKINTQGFG